MHRLSLCTLWFFGSVWTVLFMLAIVHLHTSKQPVLVQAAEQLVATPAEPIAGGQSLGVTNQINAGDARADIVAAFLARHNSPLTPHDHFGQFIVQTADKYNVDYRLIPAIMMQESNLCKKIVEGSHNCLGFGIHSKGTLTFNTYEESIERATRELRSKYLDIGLTTPEKIMRKYTPHSNGSWADSVNQWIAEMEYNDREMGKSVDQDADLTEYLKPQLRVN